MKLKILCLISIVTMLLLAACGGNKQVVLEPVPVRNPLALAYEASTEGNKSYDEGLFNDAIASYTEAIALFEEAAPTSVPSDSIALNIEKMNLNIAKSNIDMAGESITANMYNEAIVSYENALSIYKALNPISITKDKLKDNILGVYNNLAITAKSAGNYEQAIKYYDSTLAIQPNDPEILNAKFFVLSDNIKDEARAYTVLIEYAEASQDAAAFINLADRYVERGNTVEAGKYYMKALALRPDADMYRRMANFYRASKDWKNANLYLEKLVATNPPAGELATIYTMIGKNYDEMGDKKKMVEYYEKSITIDKDPQLALLLASYYNGTKTYSKVVTYATITIAADSRNSDALMLRGLAYYQLKNYTSAKVDLERIQNDAKWGAQAKNLLKDKKMPK
ncbi:MAG: tetratricopeptide repeat protein [Candidatus Cloacimonetes bacterium]|nr:tetratricopeptide repeat protein [Candidatus Cloacimonadota bacterium]MDD3234760.1 tetratricopeptide repeat protein [Candidatus Cloacimonadota bacterium]